MIVLQATQDIRKVSLWLGHANLATTEIYTRADPSEKLEAINATVPPHLRKGTFRPPDKLLALLRDRSYGKPNPARGSIADSTQYSTTPMRLSNQMCS